MAVWVWRFSKNRRVVELLECHLPTGRYLEEVMNLWRIHIRPRGGCGEPGRSWAVCMNQRLLGLGWGVTWPGGIERTPENYFELGEQIYGDRSWRSNLRTLIHQVQVNDLIWTRDPMARYYLGRVTGSWQYIDGIENLDADILNIRPVAMYEVGLEERVTGAIVNSFRPQKAIQPVLDPASVIFSKRLFNELSKAEAYEVERLKGEIWSYLHPFDIENVVYVYLQAKGYIVFPARRQADTMRYEFELAHRDDGHRAVASVKSGGVPLTPSEFGGYRCKVFLFAVSQNYPGERPPNVTTLTSGELIDFMRDRRNILPEAVKSWMAFAGI